MRAEILGSAFINAAAWRETVLHGGSGSPQSVRAMNARRNPLRSTFINAAA